MFFQRKDTIYKNSPKGTGIGLYLGRLLAELHNGKLYLDDRKKTVNSFLLRLPRQQDICISLRPNEQKAVQPSGEEQAVEQSNKPESLPAILLVEDEKEMLAYVASELSVHYRVMKATNGKEALNILNHY